MLRGEDAARTSHGACARGGVLVAGSYCWKRSAGRRQMDSTSGTDGRTDRHMTRHGDRDIGSSVMCVLRAEVFIPLGSAT